MSLKVVIVSPKKRAKKKVFSGWVTLKINAC